MDEDENFSDDGYGVVRIVVVLLFVRRACLGVQILSHAESHANSYSEAVRVGMSVDVDRSCCMDVRASGLPHLRIGVCAQGLLECERFDHVLIPEAKLTKPRCVNSPMFPIEYLV